MALILQIDDTEKAENNEEKGATIVNVEEEKKEKFEKLETTIATFEIESIPKKEIKSNKDEKRKNASLLKANQNANVRATFIHIIGDIIQS